MAVVKIEFVKHMATLMRYVLDGKEPSDPVDTHDCHESNVAQDFESIAQQHHGKGRVNAIHVMQSWGKEESKTFSPEEFNAMGRQLVEEKFPGHAFLIVTHTETSKVHNHIVVSPWHSETGKKIENKKRHLYELRDINDAICKSRGLSVIDQAGKDRQARLPEKVQKIAQFNGRSWLIDLCQKADFARAYATASGDQNLVVAMTRKDLSWRSGRMTRSFRVSQDCVSMCAVLSAPFRRERLVRIPEKTLYLHCHRQLTSKARRTTADLLKQIGLAIVIDPHTNWICQAQ